MEEPRTKHDHTPEEERRIREAALDKTIADSFPASDPPSTNPNPDDDTALEQASKHPSASARGSLPGAPRSPG